MPYYRKNLYVLSVTMFLASVSWNQIVPFLPLFLKDIGVKQNMLVQWTGLVFAAQSVASILMLPYWGKLGDKYGRKPMVIRAGICLSAIYFGMSFCRSPWELAFYRFLNGALTGFIPGSFALIATNTPDDLAPAYVARAQSVCAMGQIVGPAIGGVLAAAIGYRMSMKASSAAVAFSVLLVCLQVKEPNKIPPETKTSLFEDFKISLTSAVMASVMLTALIQTMFISAIGPMLALHLAKLGGEHPKWLTGAVYALPSMAFFISATRWTHVGERLGFDRVIYLGLIGTAAGAFCLTFAHNIWIFGVVFFTASVFLAAISPAAAAVICTRVDEEFRGRAYGMQVSAGTLGALIAPLAASQIGGIYGIPAVFMFVGAVFALGVPAFGSLLKRWEKLPERESAPQKTTV